MRDQNRRRSRSSMTAYLHDLQRCQPLTREEEQALTSEYAECRSPAVRRRIVSSYLRLVVSIAKAHHMAPSISLVDLIQEGNLGLLRAVEKYDPQRGASLSTYATYWIRAFILRFVLDNYRIARVRQTHAQRFAFYRLRREINALTARGMDATDEELASRIGVTEADVTDVRRLLNANLNTDGETNGEQDADAARPDSNVESREAVAVLGSKLRAFGDTLTGRDQDIFRSRLLADRPQKRPEIAARHGVTPGAIQQSELRLIHRIKAHLESELGDSVHLIAAG